MQTTQTLNKITFFKDLGYEPHKGQQEVHASTAHRRILSCGVRWGKTLCAAMEGLAAALEPKERSMGWVVAPTDELADKVFRELVILTAEHLRHRIVTLKEGEKRLIIRNMAGGISEIRGKSADNPVSLLGEGLDWLIVDEAAQLKPKIYESYLSQRLIDKKGWALLISTPKGKGWFYDLYRLGQSDDPDHQSWNSPSWSNPYLDRQLIEKERMKVPESVFEQEYGGKFIEGAGAVFRKVREAATGGWQEPRRGEGYSAGLDLAKVQDFSVLVIMNANREVMLVDRFNKLDWNIQVNRIQATTEKYNDAYVHVDSTGAGEPVYEALLNAGIRCTPYTFTQKSKAALIDSLSIIFEKELITLPRPDLFPAMVEELENFQYSVTDQGNVKSSAPFGYHDDCVIALALAAWPLRKDYDYDWMFDPLSHNTEGWPEGGSSMGSFVPGFTW